MMKKLLLALLFCSPVYGAELCQVDVETNSTVLCPVGEAVGSIGIAVLPSAQSVSAGSSAKLKVSVIGPASDVIVTDTAGFCGAVLGAITAAIYACTIPNVITPITGTLTATSSNGSASVNYAVNVLIQGNCNTFSGLPAHCSTPAHNACLAKGGLVNFQSPPRFWGGYWNTPGSTESIQVGKNSIVAAPFTPPGPGFGAGDNPNNGLIQFTGPTAGWKTSISDCPGDFSPIPPAVESTGACVSGGFTAWSIRWTTPLGGTTSANTCVILQPGQRYFLNIAAAVQSAEGAWVTQCTSPTCTIALNQREN